LFIEGPLKLVAKQRFIENNRDGFGANRDGFGVGA
jgi:hypothetical protein